MHRFRSGWWARLSWLLIGLSLVLFARLCFRHGGYFAEDAYISFRFAENLAGGHGLVWNVGGERVEGYTSPLHILLLAVMVLIGLPVQGWALAIGIFSVLGLAMLFWVIVRREADQVTPLSALLLAGYLVDSRLAVHATAGLDTVMYMCLLAGNFLVSLRFVDAPSRRTAIWLSLVNFASLLGRPDAAPFIAAQGLVLGAAALRDRALLRPGLLAYGLLFGLGLLYMGWKLLYFGYLLPNPFYVKANDPGALHGLASVIEFVTDMWWMIPALLLMVFADRAALRAWWDAPRTRVKAALVAFPPLAFLLYYTTVIQEVNYAGRFEYASYFFFVVAAGTVLSIGRPLERLLDRFSPAWVQAVAAALLVGALLSLYKGLALWFPWFKIVETQFYRPIGEALASTGLRSEGKLIFDSAGVVPYVSGFAHIDPVGLTDNTLSGRKPIAVPAREDYLWKSDADVYIGPEPPATPGSTRCEDEPVMKSEFGKKILLSQSRIKKHAAYFRIYGHLTQPELCAMYYRRMRVLRDEWTLVGEVRFPLADPAGFTMFGFVRKRSPHHDALVRALTPIIARKPSELTPNQLYRD